MPRIDGYKVTLPMPADGSSPTVAVVAFDGISPFHLSVPCVVFGEGRPGVPSHRLIVCGMDAGPIRTTAGFDIAVGAGLESLEQAETVIVPSWRDPAETAPAALCAALAAAAGRGATVVGLCLGAYVLADAGLLDGRRATTHWAFVDDFAARYPSVSVDGDVLYVEDGGVVTSAGTTAGLDCCLHLLRRSHGSEIANRVARRLVMAPHRQGGQAQYIERPIPENARDSRLSGLLEWLRANLNVPHRIDDLAARAMVSRSTFTRHFHDLTGQTVGDWLAAERLALAQRLLEGTDRSVEFIADAAGFGSAASLRHHFSNAFGVSPRAWRKTFRG